jgi:hypothetical protein
MKEKLQSLNQTIAATTNKKSVQQKAKSLKKSWTQPVLILRSINYKKPQQASAADIAKRYRCHGHVYEK